MHLYFHIWLRISLKIKILVVGNALLCLVNFYAQVTKKCPILTKINRFSVSNCLDWFNSNRLVVNASKSSTMIITTPYNITNICKPFINDATLEHNTSSKLLGIMIDQTLKWDTHVIKVRLQKINPKGYATRERFLQRIRQNTPNLQKILSRDGVFNEIVIARHAQLNPFSR